jgi:hypothetical protein
MLIKMHKPAYHLGLHLVISRFSVHIQSFYCSAWFLLFRLWWWKRDFICLRWLDLKDHVSYTVCGTNTIYRTSFVLQRLIGETYVHSFCTHLSNPFLHDFYTVLFMHLMHQIIVTKKVILYRFMPPRWGPFHNHRLDFLMLSLFHLSS